MRDNNPILTEEQLDFTREMMNIGAGNAVTAMQMLLKCPVDLIIPRVCVLPVRHLPSILGDPTALVACVRMGMVGNLSGSLFFIVTEKDAKKLVTLAEKAMTGLHKFPGRKPEKVELSAIAEIGNIICGVYLTAIHDFCGLSIYHTVPILAVDMVQSLLDESLVKTSLQIRPALLVENEFLLEDHHIRPALLIENEFKLVERRIRTFMMIIPSPESIKPMIDSLAQAKKAYGSA